MSSITIDSATGKFVGDAPVNQIEIMRDATSAVSIAESYVIDSPEMRAAAYSDISAWKKKKTALDEERMKVSRPLLEAQRALNAMFKAPMDRLDEAIRIASVPLLVYDNKVREEAAAERRKQEAIAEAERKRLADIEAAERRKAAEEAAAAQRAIDEEKRKAEEAIAAAAKEDERLRQQAEAAARSGDIEAQREAEELAAENARKAQEAAFAAQIEVENKQKAAALAAHEAQERANAAALAAATTSAQSVEEADTKGSRATWKGKCTDKMALLKFVVANPAFIHLVVVDEKALNAQAKAMKSAMQIDGCMAYQERTLVASRG